MRWRSKRCATRDARCSKPPTACRRPTSCARWWLDLLVTDVGLPGDINARQVADAAKRLRPGLKVLFITGYAENAVLSHGSLSPGMHIMTKPFELATFARRVKDLLDAETGHGPASNIEETLNPEAGDVGLCRPVVVRSRAGDSSADGN